MNKKIIVGIIIVVAVLFVGYLFQEVEDPIVENGDEEIQEIAETWISEEAPTFVDREGESLQYVETIDLGDGLYEVVFTFDTRFAGYGSVDEDEMAAQVITPRVIVVSIEDNEVVGAITDGIFDEMSEEMIEAEDEDVDDEILDSVTVDLYYVEVVDGQEELVAVEREIDLVNGVEYSAIIALLEGVSEDEDYITSIPEEAQLLDFEIADGVAVLDFSADIEPAGGSAWVTSIRDQITETLLQFNSVEEVIILVEGDEDGLQP